MTEQEQDLQIAFDSCCDVLSKLNDIVAAVTAVTAATSPLELSPLQSHSRTSGDGGLSPG